MSASVTPDLFRKARDYAGLSRTRATALTGVDSATLRRWEVGTGVEVNEVEAYEAAFGTLAARADQVEADYREWQAAAKQRLPEWKWQPIVPWRERPPIDWSRKKVFGSTYADVIAGSAQGRVYTLVNCTMCGAPAGQHCVGPRGGRCTWHADRRAAAARAVKALHVLASGPTLVLFPVATAALPPRLLETAVL